VFKEYELDALAVFDAVNEWNRDRPGRKIQLAVPHQPRPDGSMVTGIVLGPLTQWASTFAANADTLELCARVTRLVPNATFVQLVTALDLVYGNQSTTGDTRHAN
jgi:hypothetical protein